MKNYYITEVGSKVEIFDEKYIDLSYECIIKVFITDLPKCVKLRLDNNSLKSVELNLPKCERLDLHYNKLKSVELNLPKCEKLYLDYNKLKSVELSLPKCEILFLDNNKLESVDLNLPKCEKLFLNHNKLKSVELNLPKIVYMQSDLIRFTQSNGDIVIGADGVPTIVDSEKKLGEFTIYKGRYKSSHIEVIIASRGEYFAHGDTIKKAIEDCNFKFLQATIDVGPYFAECKKKDLMTVIDYRLLTGACESGCKNFLESKGITSTEIKFDDAMELLEENEPYGWDRIKKLI